MTYPNTLPALPTNHVDDAREPILAEYINGLAREVNAIGAELGLNPSMNAATIAALLAGIMNPDGTLKTSAVTGAGGGGGASLLDFIMANDGPAKSVTPDFSTLTCAAGTPVTFPTGYPSNDVVEPAILHDYTAPFFADADGKNGWEYVACMGGYYQSNIIYESANLWVSHDGKDGSWVYVVFNAGIGTPTPGYAGVLTPVVAQNIQGDGGISDPYLVRGPDGVFYILFNQFLNSTVAGGTGVAGKNWGIKGISSEDMKSWSAPVTLLQTVITADRPASPSAGWDENGWQIYGVVTGTARNGTIWKMTCPTANLLGAWGNLTDVIAPLPAAFNTRQWWHLNVYRWGTTWLILVQDNVINSSAGGNLWLLWSTDRGATWNVPSKPLLAGNGYYRAAMVITDRGFGVGLDIFYGLLSGTFQMGRTFAAFTPTVLPAISLGKYGAQTHAIEMESARRPLWPYIVGDTVIRADNALSPGIADSGQPWVVMAGSGVCGIQNKQFYAVDAGNHKCAIITPGAADGVYACRFSVIDFTQQQWFMVRVKDVNNWVRVGYNSTSGYQIQNIVAAGITQTVVFAGPVVPVSGDVIVVVCFGQTITVFVNGVQIGQVTNYANNVGESGIGWQTNNVSNQRFDNFSMRPLIGGS